MQTDYLKIFIAYDSQNLFIIQIYEKIPDHSQKNKYNRASDTKLCTIDVS